MNDQDRRIENLLRSGVPKVRIARQLGITRETVARVGARVGFPTRQRGPARHDWKEVREFYGAGHSASACMRRFGFSPSTWAAAIARGEIVPRPRDAQLPPGRRRKQVAKLLADGRGIAEIASQLGVSKPTVCYHARRLGVPSRQEFARRYDWDEIRRAYESGLSLRECLKRFGFSRDAWAEAVKRGDIVPRPRAIPIEELLVVGRTTTRTHLKGRLLKEGLKANRCEECGISEWRGKPLSLQLHHENGDGRDNQLENLVLLCANCHSQTDTYGGRNGYRKGGHLEVVDPPGPADDAPPEEEERIA